MTRLDPVAVNAAAVESEPNARHMERSSGTSEESLNNANSSIPSSHGDKVHVVKAQHGYAFRVKSGSRFRIIDLHGLQVVDMMAWVTEGSGTSTQSASTTLPYPSAAIPRPTCQYPLRSSPTSSTTAGPAPVDVNTAWTVLAPSPAPLPLEKLSMAYTRFHLHGATPATGEWLYTNADRALLQLTRDTVRTHDMTFMSCNPALYASYDAPDHRSCSGNIFEAMRPFGMRSELEARATDPFNVFQNTPLYTLKPLNCSRPGDFVEFEASADCVVAVSCCPFDFDGFNGGKVTDIGIVEQVGGD